MRGEGESDLSGLYLAGVGIVRQLCDPHVVGVAGLVLHLREDAGGVLSKDGVECDQGLEHSAPLELVQAPHAVENGGEWRSLYGRKFTGLEGFLGAIKDVLQLRQLERLRQNRDLLEQEGVTLLRLLNIGGEGFGRPDPLGR